MLKSEKKWNQFTKIFKKNIESEEKISYIKMLYDRGVEQLVARWAHNPKVGGSNPPPATKILKRAYFISPFYLVVEFLLSCF